MDDHEPFEIPDWRRNIQRVNARALRALTADGSVDDVKLVHRSLHFRHGVISLFDILLAQERRDLFDEALGEAYGYTAPTDSDVDPASASTDDLVDVISRWEDPPEPGVATLIAQVLHRAVAKPTRVSSVPPTQSTQVMGWLSAHTRQCLARRDYLPLISYARWLMEENVRHVFRRAEQIGLIAREIASNAPEPQQKNLADLRRFVRTLVANQQEQDVLTERLDTLVDRLGAGTELDVLASLAVGLELYGEGFPLHGLRLLNLAYERVRL